MADTKVTLKLLIDKKSQQVLFAEAEKKFVDFLFSIFTLPVGTVTRLLQKQSMAGCLRSLYESIENLNDIYIEPGQVKGFLLNPKVAISGATVLPDLLLPSVEQSYTARKIYRCGHCFEYVAHDRGSICPSCAKSMTSELIYVDPPSLVKSYTRSRFYRCAKNRCKHVAINGTTICPSCGNPMPYEQSYVHPPRNIKASSSSEGGYVKGVITYMVMDNLEVKPMSTISSITLLTKFNVRDVRAVEEKVVDFGMDEVQATAVIPFIAFNSFCACITTIYQILHLLPINVRRMHLLLPLKNKLPRFVKV
jgi:RNA polymerase subunit RPABC4/transcription elongation factor Spt4